MADYSTHNPQEIILLNKIKNELVELNKLAPSLLDSGSEPIGATLIKTGQTTSYSAYDDGDLQIGRATDFFTLDTNNVFGNTDRFTDTLGTQIYANNIVLDHSTDNGTTILGYYRTLNPSLNYADAQLYANSLVVDGLSGWHLTNVRELINISNYDASVFNYPPFNISKTNGDILTSTRRSALSTYRWRIRRNSGEVRDNWGLGAVPSISCKYITYTELGL